MVGGPAVVLGQTSLDDYQNELLTARQPNKYGGDISEVSSTAIQRDFSAAICDIATRIEYLEYANEKSKSASSAHAMAVGDNSSYATPAYCTWAKGYSGNQPIYTTSSIYTFLPSTGALKTTQFSISSGGTAIQTANGMYGIANTSINFAVNSILSATLTTTIFKTTQYTITGGSAAGSVDGMYGVPGTSLSFSVNGFNVATITPVGIYAPEFNNVTVTKPATGSIFTLADGKTLSVGNTIALSAVDGSTLAIGAGGTLGSAAYTASNAYVPSKPAVPSGGGAPLPGVAYDQSIAVANNTLLNIIQSALIADGILS